MCERHYFSLISETSLGFDCRGHFDRNRSGPCINFKTGVKLERRLRPLESDDDESPTQRCFMRGESERYGPITCVCREKTRGGITAASVCVCVYMTFYCYVDTHFGCIVARECIMSGRVLTPHVRQVCVCVNMHVQ